MKYIEAIPNVRAAPSVWFYIDPHRNGIDSTDWTCPRRETISYWEECGLQRTLCWDKNCQKTTVGDWCHIYSWFGVKSFPETNVWIRRQPTNGRLKHQGTCTCYFYTKQFFILLTQYICVFRITHNELPFFLKLLVCVMLQCEVLVARKFILNIPVYKIANFAVQSFCFASVCPEFKSWPGGYCLSLSRCRQKPW